MDRGRQKGKKVRGQYLAILTAQARYIRDLLYGKMGLNFVHSGSRSEHRIHLILRVCGACHEINLGCNSSLLLETFPVGLVVDNRRATEIKRKESEIGV